MTVSLASALSLPITSITLSVFSFVTGLLSTFLSTPTSAKAIAEGINKNIATTVFSLISVLLNTGFVRFRSKQLIFVDSELFIPIIGRRVNGSRGSLLLTRVAGPSSKHLPRTELPSHATAASVYKGKSDPDRFSWPLSPSTGQMVARSESAQRGSSGGRK